MFEEKGENETRSEIAESILEGSEDLRQICMKCSGEEQINILKCKICTRFLHKTCTSKRFAKQFNGLCPLCK